MVQWLVRYYDHANVIREILQIQTCCSTRLSVTKEMVTGELQPPDRPKNERALPGLCEDLTAEQVILTWAGRRLIYKVAETAELSTAA